MNVDTFSIPVKEQISLRFIRSDEADALYRLVDKNRRYLRVWLDWVDAQNNPHISRKNILERVEKAKKGVVFDLGIYEGNTLIGSIGLNTIVKKVEGQKLVIG